jgi:hypothetical protein
MESKVFAVPNEALRHKDVWVSRVTAPRIPAEKQTVPFGSVNPKAGLDAVKRKISALRQEPNPDSPARSLVTIMTELYAYLRSKTRISANNSQLLSNMYLASTRRHIPEYSTIARTQNLRKTIYLKFTVLRSLS